ncbi:MAG TPA: glutamate racemase [Deltaproteobacteria bacterium]|nr:MAG: glutamate racemase [Deltaproteobacteria bacterium GWA2_45_12]HBF13735.1 glutamate racemase [Deltaproteobacteria bacterium]
MSTQPIGVFDSGIGGLTVLQEIRKVLPFEDLIYLGDTARVPYGTKSKETVLRYSVQNTHFLLEQNVKAVVVACNTASAYALDYLQSQFKVPVLGVIKPGAERAISLKSRNIGVIGTEGTIRSQAYAQALYKLDSQAVVVSKACPLLVGLAEEGWVKGEIVAKILEVYLKPFMAQKIDSLILGCTHYPLFKEEMARLLGKDITLVDSAEAVTTQLKKTLDDHSLKNPDAKRKGWAKFYSTDSPDRMKRIGHYFWGSEMGEITKVELANN